MFRKFLLQVDWKWLSDFLLWRPRVFCNSFWRPKFKILTDGKNKIILLGRRSMMPKFHASNHKNELFSAWADIGATYGFYFPFWDINE